MLVMLVSVPLIVFMVVVAPLWLILHYRSKKRSEGGLSQEDYEQLAALSAKADSLQQRVHTLEKILDDETPNWRSHYEET
ncbi:envelope stress response membrane protein PspB [Vibrio ruber]|uniref:Phage shock protein B n=1 Tax=Vibrio ruber (strain DSM 16370 / JCM 11486 / BCRC 17186 / CECT 7878 / LMG 23124 / VR1) TaxID=1123498 RepID=A0A1R4LJM0_VIBR1|nr:envelope stress response membrane protein PspB [Vibrio ruber]WNJ95281.1 envelope stress response membrane protein PspB [Vibrio ruber]SJN56750.1 Phage shock protein B [Vibrio ruber DSM 16370]